jgi:TolB-like protein
VLAAAVTFLLVDEFAFDRQSEPEDEIVATKSQSIAVLPFANMSEDNDHFADGLS